MMFHLGWFTNAIPHGWNWNGAGADRWAGNDLDRWQTGEFLMDMATQLDRAGFDFIMLEDHVAFDPTHETARLDPMMLAPLLGSVTKGLGIVSTISTSFCHPFLLARQTATLEQLTRGRSGWNIVTTSEKAAAEAFGMAEQPPHDERYVRAGEFTDVVTQLWEAWAPDAIAPGVEPGKYVNSAKVKMLDFEGKYYKTKGALNISRSPQGKPVLCQAGTSEMGKEFEGDVYGDARCSRHHGRGGAAQGRTQSCHYRCAMSALARQHGEGTKDARACDPRLQQAIAPHRPLKLRRSSRYGW
jgi:alkanesulfonate monooxygenase SsuD/methylene tetrahydromethanopterin reductase-like flavin-dependent oxidoreductase (luciferase family)